MADELHADIEELRSLHSVAKRPRIRSILSSHIQSLEKESVASNGVQKAEPVAQKAEPVPSSVTKAPQLSYTSLSSFSWDQDNEKIKIYIFLEGVNQEKIDPSFQQWSFDLKIHDVQGKNYRCGIPKLHKAIVPDQCKIVVKPQRVTVFLKKAEKGNWLDIYFKEDKLKPSLDKDKDPMAGIMDLMKNMYEEGDEDMKRTIAKAWTESRSGKSPDFSKTGM